MDLLSKSSVEIIQLKSRQMNCFSTRMLANLTSKMSIKSRHNKKQRINSKKWLKFSDGNKLQRIQVPKRMCRALYDVTMSRCVFSYYDITY